MTTGIEGMTCRRCGSRLQNGAATCQQCGSATTGSAPTETTPNYRVSIQPPPTAPPPVSLPQQPPQQLQQQHPYMPAASATAGLPAGLRLAGGESLQYRADFSPHLILSHLKVTLLLTDRRIIVQKPHTLFGIIPHGYVEEAVPLSAVSEVIAGDRVLSRKLVWGVCMALFGLFLLIESGGYGPLGVVLGLALLVGAGFAFFTSRVLGVFVRNHGAGIVGAPAGRQEHDLVEQAKAAINELVFATGSPVQRP